MPAFRPPKPPPKPGGLAVWRLLPMWLANGLSVLSEKAYTMKMGQFRLPTRMIYMLNDPPLIRAVLGERAAEFPKSDIMGVMLRRLMGDSIFTSNGARWRRQRQMMNPAFEAARIKAVFDQMAEATAAMIGRLDRVADGSSYLIDTETTHVTADIILRTIFTTSIDQDAAARVYAAFNRFQEISYAHGMLRVFRLPAFLAGGTRRAEAAAHEIRGLLQPLIQARIDALARGEAGEFRDILAAMIEARDPADGSAFSFEELYEQVAMLFLAGHETSASALAWTLYLIANDPALQERLHAETAGVLGDRAPAFGDLRALPLLRDVFREALRLYPPVAFFPRDPVARECMRGKEVKPGSILFVSPWMLHRNQRYWDAPDDFMPCRFATPEGEAAAATAYLPFSTGPRVCLGASFAQQEAILILASIMRRYRLDPDPDHVPKPVARLTLRSENGIRLKLTRRGQ